jgi:hydroxymethylbilane synthase
MKELVVGTRGSELALWQTRLVMASIPGPCREVVIKTTGDRFQDVPLHEAGAIGLFTKDIEDQLLAGAIDLAVHSMKDLPTRLAPGLAFAALLKRAAPSDLLLVRPESHDPSRRIPVRVGGVVGASSLRRQALLGRWAADLGTASLRGNVTTRVAKLKRGDCDAIVLARAGISRLELDVTPILAYDLNPEAWVGAPGQGVIGVEAREDDTEVRERLAPLDHARSRACAEAERRLLQVYGGGCHAPFGALARDLPAGGVELLVAAPGEGGYHVERFTAGDIAGAEAAATAWIHSPRAARGVTPEPTWICRPAQPWC